MKVLKSDRHNGVLRVVPTGPEDLWLLFNFIQAGDRVVSRTHRVLHVGSDDKPEKVRKPITARLVVTKKNLDMSSSKLNLSGVVEMAPDDVEGVKGRSHTISVEPGAQITVLKATQDPMSWKLLDRMRGSHLRALILSIDYGNSAVGIFSDSGMVEVSEIRRNISGKENPDQRRKDVVEFFKEVASSLENLSSRAPGPIAVVGPGFAKEDFVSYLGDKHEELRTRVKHLGTSTSGTPAGVMESVRSGSLSNFLKDLRFSQESALVEELLKLLATEPDKVALGLDEVSRSSAAGAVSHLLVLESILQAEDVDPEILRSTLLAAQKSSANITFVSPRHEGGEKLKSLGLIAALLRYSFFPREK